MVVLPHIRRKYMASRLPAGVTVQMSECVVTLASDSVAYTGSARTVGVTVTWQGATLAVGVDYSVSFSNNVNVGPAIATVTGMGQFSGVVRKTFYVVSDASVPWTFDITKTTLVGSLSYNTNGGAVQVWGFNDNYDGNGNGFFSVALWSSGSWLRGFEFPRDGNGEFHLANLDMSSPVTVDSAGISGYQHAIGFSADGKTTFWCDNGSSVSMIKQKSGATAFDFSSMTYSGDSPDLHDDLASGNNTLYTRTSFSKNGRYVFVMQPYWTVLRYTLGTPFDVTTLDASSKSVQRFLNTQNSDFLIGVCFNSDGSQAIASLYGGTRFYHASLSSPFDLGTATEIGHVTLSATASSMCVLNGGKTLLAGNTGGLYEYALSA